MAFLDELLEGGSTYRVKLSEGGASFRPNSSSDDDLEAFQDIAQQIVDNDGDGYSIDPEPHVSSERGGNLIDLIVIAIGEDD